MDNYRKIFVGYNDAELKILWDEAVFVFDNNVLLDLYRGSKKTRDFMLKAMTDLQDRIWLPYQVILEFYKNRPEIIFTSVDRFAKLEAQILKLKDNIHTTLMLESKNTYFDSAIDSLIQNIKDYKDETTVVSNPRNDSILEKLIYLFSNKIGDNYTPEKLNKLFEECEKRYKEEIPPGYKDLKKPVPERYGDFIIWKQILEYANQNNKSIIFISRDQKEDWFHSYGGKTIGPRYELRLEFMEYTNKMFHIYDLNQFLNVYSTNTGTPLDESVVENVNKLNSNYEMGVWPNNNLINYFNSNSQEVIINKYLNNNDVKGNIEILTELIYFFEKLEQKHFEDMDYYILSRRTKNFNDNCDKLRLELEKNALSDELKEFFSNRIEYLLQLVQRSLNYFEINLKDDISIEKELVILQLNSLFTSVRMLLVTLVSN